MDATINRVGYWSALTAFLATVAFDIAQTTQLLGLLRYPADERWIYGSSLCIGIPLLLAMKFHRTLRKHDNQKT